MFRQLISCDDHWGQDVRLGRANVHKVKVHDDTLTISHLSHLTEVPYQVLKKIRNHELL